MKTKDFPTETDRDLHRRWILIPAVIFVLLAAVAVFGHGRPDLPQAQTPAGDRL
jgi:hypothetical protein